MADLILPSRRSLLLGLSASIICAPAVVRASSLMVIKPWAEESMLLPPGKYLFGLDHGYKVGDMLVSCISELCPDGKIKILRVVSHS